MVVPAATVEPGPLDFCEKYVPYSGKAVLEQGYSLRGNRSASLCLSMQWHWHRLCSLDNRLQGRFKWPNRWSVFFSSSCVSSR